MHMTLIQMDNGKVQHTKLEDAQQHADKMINEIETIRQKNLDYEKNLLNN